jgi:cytochrome c-type biogenesis protein CcmF
MIAEIGLFALIVALLVSAIQSTVPLIGAARGEVSWMKLAPAAAGAQFALVTLAFAALVWLHVTSDFSVVNVFQNSHTDKPLLYKITGVWGNHEGSMLLWTFILALYGMAVAVFGGALPPGLRARALAVQGMIAFGFLLFILMTSYPFARLDPPPVNGNGLNPILQDPGLAFHPPFLYLGYVGFSMAFSFAIAALIEGRVDAAWARWVRPWTLVAWCALTLGIAMGSWWSYYTLGWGGWWAWDPVENASFMPWLAGTALLHSAVVAEKRDTLKGWTIFLAILTFSLSLLGTFLVRSGVLTSVHAFANDPARGRFILILLSLVTGGSLILFALRAGALKASGIFSPVSREGAIVFNNVFLSAAAGTVFLGTLTPLGIDALLDTPRIANALHLSKLSVGAPYYDLMMPLLFVPLLVLMPLGPLLSWKRGDGKGALRQMGFAAIVTALTVIAVLIITGFARSEALAALGLGLAAWLATGTLTEWTSRAGLFRLDTAHALSRIQNMPRSAHGMTIAHLGMAIVLIGITGSLAWQTEKLLVLKPGQSFSIAGYDVRLAGVDDGMRGPNYTASRATFLASRGGDTVAVLQPERRIYDNPPEPKSTVGIRTNFVSDLYLVLGEADGQGGYAVHAFHNPLVPWLYFGAILMVLGGLVSLSDRRYRIGAPKRAKRVLDLTPKAAPRFKVPVAVRYALPAIAFLALVGVFFWRLNQTGQGDTPNLIPSALIDQPAPTFDLPPLYTGQQGFKTADLKGHVTLVNFFASWCVPCRAEHPVLSDLRKSGITLVGINYKDKPENAQGFLAELGNPYRTIAVDAEGRTGIDFGVYGVPESYVIDKDGIIRDKIVGPLTPDVVRNRVLPLAEKLK